MLKQAVKRINSVAPLFMDFTVLWIYEIVHIPLGLFLLGLGLASTASIALAMGPALAQIAPPRTLSDDAMLVVLGAVLTGAFGFLAWALIDRLGWARKDERIANHDLRLNEHGRKIEQIQRDIRDMPTRGDHEELKGMLQAGQTLTQSMITDLGNRLWELAGTNAKPKKG